MALNFNDHSTFITILQYCQAFHGNTIAQCLAFCGTLPSASVCICTISPHIHSYSQKQVTGTAHRCPLEQLSHLPIQSHTVHYYNNTTVLMAVQWSSEPWSHSHILPSPQPIKVLILHQHHHPYPTSNQYHIQDQFNCIALSTPTTADKNLL